MVVRIKAVAGEEWLEELLALQRECLPECEPQDPTVGDWWLAFDGDVPVAFASLMPSDKVTCAGYLSRAGVIKAYRGQGLQKRLIKVRLAKAKKYGWTTVRSDTRNNPPSSNNLIACGFRIFTPDKPWAFADSIYFQRKIAA